MATAKDIYRLVLAAKKAKNIMKLFGFSTAAQAPAETDDEHIENVAAQEVYENLSKALEALEEFDV